MCSSHTHTPCTCSSPYEWLAAEHTATHSATSLHSALHYRYVELWFPSWTVNWKSDTHTLTDWCPPAHKQYQRASCTPPPPRTHTHLHPPSVSQMMWSSIPNIDTGLTMVDAQPFTQHAPSQRVNKSLHKPHRATGIQRDTGRHWEQTWFCQPLQTHGQVRTKFQERCARLNDKLMSRLNSIQGVLALMMNWMSRLHSLRCTCLNDELDAKTKFQEGCTCLNDELDAKTKFQEGCTCLNEELDVKTKFQEKVCSVTVFSV